MADPLKRFVAAIALAGGLVAAPAYAKPPKIDCVNHDQRPNIRKDQIRSCRDSVNDKIRAAARRFCASTKDTDERLRCRQIKPLLDRCVCQVELHQTGDDGAAEPAIAYAWLGGDPAGNPLYWGVELDKNKREWSVRSIFFEDYERP